MRWKFIEPNDHVENSQRSLVIEKIDAWWQEFQRKSDDISAIFSRKSDLDLPEWMVQNLEAIAPGLMWEFGPAIRKTGHRLVVTPESRRDLRPLVQTILQRAPAMNDWEFYGYRLPEDLESTLPTVQGRTGIDIKDFRFRASIGNHNRIDLVFTVPDIAAVDAGSGQSAAFVATETLLGERCLDTWIGAIEFVRFEPRFSLKSLLPSFFGNRRQEFSNYLPLERSKEVVQALIGSIQDQLPRQPHYDWVTDDGWTMWELKPNEADEYAQQQDLFVARSPNEKMWTAAHSSTLFASERFSRCGETFCFIKFDSSEGFGRENVEEKYRIEEELSTALKQLQLGCCIGGGTGLRYSYIDLALTDLDKGIQTIREQLRTEQIPLRSWILFYDSDLVAEWIGIYEDAPAPPLLLPTAPDDE